MPFEHDQRAEAPFAALTPVTSPTITTSEEGANDDTVSGSQAEMGRPPLPSKPPRRWGPGLAIIAGTLVLVSLIFMLADAGRTTAGQSGQVAKHATATPRPTATATPFPTPTPMTGFQVYMDRPDGFVMQYPLTWSATDHSPGVDFLDDTQNLTYQVQLIVPGDATSIGLQGDPNDPASWLNFAMNQLSSSQDGFQQVAGPIPATSIGGKLWQSSVALFTIANVSVRVQVYATVFDGKPYILSLWAADERFDTGRALYFDPMLRSFQFLPPTP